jgi:hypothetical protein
MVVVGEASVGKSQTYHRFPHPFLLFYGKKDLLEGTFKPKPEESFYANQRLAQKHL